MIAREGIRSPLVEINAVIYYRKVETSVEPCALARVCVWVRARRREKGRERASERGRRVSVYVTE